MKIYKQHQHSLLIKSFGIGDRLYLTLTVMLYLDLMAPESPLTEQDLWKTIPDHLRPTPLLDAGMPKPRGEMLVTGSCFAPRGTTRPASLVSVQVGELQKTLHVYGNRFWKKNYGMYTLTDPLPFSEMPVIWSNAFGGDGFEKNPTGKGIRGQEKDGGQSVIPLPNIEYPGNLIVSPDQEAEPGGFGPLDMMWPQRQKKTGTYDDKWLRENWPWFPDDMNWEYFNCAPEDQYLSGFFRGDETIEIVNMHPDMPRISSFLPGLRIRCFVTKKEEPKSETEIFQDVPTRADTVWLFPSILRGVVVYRGTTEIFDEEYADVSRIFVATERMSDPPGTMEYYLEAQRKAADRTVTINTAALEAGAKKVGNAMKRIKRIPEDIETAIRQATGKAPVMPSSPARTAAKGQQVIQDSMALLDRLEVHSRGMQAEYGHLGRIDLTMFDRMRGKLSGMSRDIDRDLKQLEAAMSRVDTAKTTALKSFSEQMTQQVPKAALDEAGIDPDHFLPEKPSVNPWHDQGFPFAIQCRRNLEDSPAMLQALHRLGLNPRSIARAWLGIHPALRIDDRSLWGLKPCPDRPGRVLDLDLPPGLVLPRFEDAVLNRLLILPWGWETGELIPAGQVIDGSDETPLFYRCGDGAPVVCISDELQAIYVNQEIGDACSFVVLETPDIRPGKDAADIICDAPVFLVVLPAGSAEKDAEPWIKAYPNAQAYPLPKGRTVFEARKLGIDIRDWIMAAMPSEFVKRHRVAPVLPAAGKHPNPDDLTVPVPKIDVQAIIDRSGAAIRAHLDGKIGDVQALRTGVEKQAMDKAREAVTRAGFDPDIVLKPLSNPEPAPGMAASGNAMADKLLEQIPKIDAAGALTPESEQTIRAEAARIRKAGQEAEVRFAAGMAKLEAAKQTASETIAKVKAQEMPAAAKAKFLEYGMDTDRMVKRTREEVIAMYSRGESLAFANLSGVDLSGLDLPGIDLHQTQCRKTRFVDTNLDGADLTQIMAQEADFSQASLKQSRLEKGMFIKSKLTGASLQEAHLSQTTLKEADLTEADFSGAILYMTSLMNSPMTGARLTGTRSELSIFSDADASAADFREARFTKCMLRRLTVTGTDFSLAAFPATILMTVTGENVIFRGADLDRGRMGNQTALPGADFRDIQLFQGCFRDSNLSGSQFTGSSFDSALMENCDLSLCNFYGIAAKGSRFSKCNLEGADMRHINLFMGSLRKSRLVNTDLRGANLFSVDFYKTTLGQTHMENANIKWSLLHRWTDILKDEGHLS